MGIKGLQKFLERHLTDENCIKEISQTELKDKAVVIDASMVLYKHICAIRNSDTDIYTEDGISITHINAIFVKINGMIKNKIKPIFVFDGKPPEIKQNLMKERSSKKNNAKDIIKTIEKKLLAVYKDLEIQVETVEDCNFLREKFTECIDLQKELLKHCKKSTHITEEQTNECVKLVKYLGIPCYVSEEEADPLCAQLIKSNLAYAVSTEDMDLLTFGTKKVIRGLKNSGKCTIYDLDLILKNLKISYKQFIDVCILLGCDYTTTIYGLGPAKILKYIREYKNIEGIIESGDFDIPENFDYVGARNEFLKLRKTPEDCEWKPPNYKKLTKFFKSFGIDDDKIEEMINNFKNSYYSVIVGEITEDEFKTKTKKIIEGKNSLMDSDED